MIRCRPFCPRQEQLCQPITVDYNFRKCIYMLMMLETLPRSLRSKILRNTNLSIDLQWKLQAACPRTRVDVGGSPFFKTEGERKLTVTFTKYLVSERLTRIIIRCAHSGLCNTTRPSSLFVVTQDVF